MKQLLTVITAPLLLLVTACSSAPEDLSGYSSCSFFDDRYIADGAQCVDANGEVVEIADSDARWLGYVEGQGPND